MMSAFFSFLYYLGMTIMVGSGLVMVWVIALAPDTSIGIPWATSITGGAVAAVGAVNS